MSMELAEGLIERGLRGIVLEHPQETVGCYEKAGLLPAHPAVGRAAVKTGVMKSIVLGYERTDGTKYVMVCTRGDRRVDLMEVRVELGLTRAETASLCSRVDEATLESVTGQKRGAIGPLLIPDALERLEAVYFARDLLVQSGRYDTLVHDVPLSLTSSVLFRAQELA